MRKQEYFEVVDNGNKLTFRITQMPASKLEDWIYRALLCLGPALGVSDTNGLSGILEKAQDMGSELFAALSKLEYGKAKPLLDEMLATAERDLGNGSYMPVSPNTIDGYVEDVTTLFKLRGACLRCNLNFLSVASPSDSTGGTARKDSSVIRMSAR